MAAILGLKFWNKKYLTDFHEICVKIYVSMHEKVSYNKKIIGTMQFTSNIVAYLFKNIISDIVIFYPLVPVKL